jgi:excisionase family DNA binding protein
MTQLLTVKQAAELLGLKVATFRAWLYQRRLPCVRCGRAIRVPTESIAQFIERNTIPAKEDRQ